MDKIYVKKVVNGLVFVGSKRVSFEENNFSVLYFTGSNGELITLYGSYEIEVPSKSCPVVIITSTAEDSDSGRVESMIEA